MQSKKPVAPTPLNLQKRCKNPHQKSLAARCTRDPPSPLSVQSTAPPNPHWHAFSGAALGVGVGAVIGGEGTSSFGSIRRQKQGKKKVDNSRCREVVRGTPSRHPARIRRPTAFLGSVVGETAPVRRRGARGPEQGSAVVLLLWGAEPWGCLERPELGLLFSREPPRECRALSAGVRCGKKGKEFALAKT